MSVYIDDVWILVQLKDVYITFVLTCQYYKIIISNTKKAITLKMVRVYTHIFFVEGIKPYNKWI